MAKAIKTDSLTIPTPGELFAALEKPGKPDWAGQYRTPIPMTYRNRAQIALNLGGLIADGFIAVEAQDSQQVKNIGTDIIKLAKALGVSENVLSRGNSINEFAENSEWDALQEELEATQNEVKASMQSHSDQDLVILVSLGGWIRGTQVVSASIIKNYDERSAKVLRQPAVVSFIHSKMNEIGTELRNEPLVKTVSDQLPALEKLVTFPARQGPHPRRSAQGQPGREQTDGRDSEKDGREMKQTNCDFVRIVDLFLRRPRFAPKRTKKSRPTNWCSI